MAAKKNSRKKPKIRFFGLTARALMLVAAALLAVCYLAMYINPANAWVLSLFGICFIPLLALNLFLLVWAALRRSKAFAIPLLALLPSIFCIGKYYQGGKDEPAGTTGTYKMVSYNVARFSRSKPEKVFEFLSGCDADIICLQEFRVEDAKKIQKYLDSHFKGYHSAYYTNVTNNGAYGNVTLSRFPVISKGKFDFEQSSNLVLYTDLQVGEHDVRLYNCHLESYALTLSALVAGRGKGETLVQATEEKMRNGITRRPQQVQIVLDDIKHCPLETIVAGDFNDTPMSYTYFKLKKGHKDAFVEAGKGFGGTFVHFRHLLRIDYMLFPKSFGIVSHTVERVRLSDHYPIMTEFTL